MSTARKHAPLAEPAGEWKSFPVRDEAAEAQLLAEGDPVWLSIINAPIDDEPETDEEREALERAKRYGVRLVDRTPHE